MIHAATTPTSSTGARPIVAWAPSFATPTAPSARATGSIVGLAIAAGYELVTFDWSQPAAFEAFGTFGIATIAAGLVGGWIFGPSSWAAQTDRDWLGLILGFAVSAVAIGAVTVGLVGGLSGLPNAASPGEALHTTIAFVALAVLFGVPTLGLFMLPITLAAAAIWALLMVVLRPA